MKSILFIFFGIIFAIFESHGQCTSISGPSNTTVGSTVVFSTYGLGCTECLLCDNNAYNFYVPAGGSATISGTNYLAGYHSVPSSGSLSVKFNTAGFYSISWEWGGGVNCSCPAGGATEFHSIAVVGGNGGNGGANNSSSSCCSYSMEIGNLYNNSIVDLLQDNSNNDVVVLGKNSSNIFVSRINGSGEIQWTKKISSVAEPYSIIKASNNSGYYITAEQGSDVVVFNISNNGNLSWSKKYGLSSNNNNPSDTKPFIVPTSGNNYFLLFNSKMTDDDGNVNSRLGLGVIKIDASGNEIWTKALRTKENFDFEHHHYISNGNNGFVTVGSAGGNGSQVMELNAQASVTKYNFNTISPYFEETGSYRVLKLQNGGYITLNSSFLSGEDRLLNIKRFNSQFNLISSNRVEDAGIKWEVEDADLVEDNSGKVYIGIVCKPTSGSSNSPHIKFIKLNQDGSQEWIKKYPYDGENIQLEASDDCNNIVFGFTKMSGSHGGKDIVLNKVDYDFNVCGIINDNNTQLVSESPINQGFNGYEEIDHVFQQPSISTSLSTLSFNKDDVCEETDFCDLHAGYTHSGVDYCIGEPISFQNTSYDNQGTLNEYIWNFGDGSPLVTSSNPTHAFDEAGDFEVMLIVGNDDNCFNCYDTITQVVNISANCPLPCENCIGSFAPIPGKKYVLSAWAKEHITSSYFNGTTYSKPYVEIKFELSGGGTQVVGPFETKGLIIDGWQQIEEEFEIPINAVELQVKLKSQSGKVYFDDVRVFPFNSNMNSYVFDPVSLRLMAELDERNYGTFYEYDEEGKLVRVKKETERGVFTIQESRSYTHKQ